MVFNESVILSAYHGTTLQDYKTAQRILECIRLKECSTVEMMAVSFRCGVRLGRNSDHEAFKAKELRREYLGLNDDKYIPAQRIQKAAGFINDPKKLRELAAFLEGRAAVMEATATAETKAPEDLPEKTAGIADLAGDTDNDVNSDGKEED